MFVPILKMAKSGRFILWIFFNLLVMLIPLFGAFKNISKDKPLIEQLKGKRVVCTFNSIYYYDREQFSPDKIDPWKCTHINYQFAFLDERDFLIIPGHEKLDIGKGFYREVTDLKKQAKGLKVLLSLGGWSDSTKKYSHFVRNKNRRTEFIKHAIDYLIKHNFDGLDVAWEYPNGCQGAIGKTPDDKKYYPIFLKELKREFEKKNLELSASVAAIRREIEAAYDVPEVSKTVDFLNIMSYDLHGAWEGKTGHHAQFHPMPDIKNSMDVITSMTTWVEKGADKKKLNVGIAAYGRSFTLASSHDNGYGAKSKSVGKPGNNTKIPGYLAYNEICYLMENDGWIVKDDAVRGPYTYKNDQWASFDSPKQVIRKTKHVIEEGYGGILVKDISSDDYDGVCYGDPYPLLDMIVKEMLHVEEKQEKLKHTSTSVSATATT